MPEPSSEAYCTSQLSKLRQTIQSWRIRKLSLLGKVHLINSRLLPRMWYVATVIRPPEYFFKELDKLVREFLWDGRGPQISLNLLAKTREEGGLGLILPRHQMTALLDSWIPKFAELLKRPNQDPKTPLWASILKHNLLSMYAPFGYDMSIFATTFTCAKLKRKGGFWYNLYQAWRSLEGGTVASLNWSTPDEGLNADHSGDKPFWSGTCRYNRKWSVDILQWEHGYLILPPNLLEKITKCSAIPRQHPPPRFPLHFCHLAEVASTAKEWEKVWTSIQKRPTLPKHRTLRWQILVERVITNSTFPGHDPKCTRCNAPRDTIRHTFFECPELTPVWHWAERCINTISGPLNTQVLNPRDLVLGDLPEAPRTVRHTAQIVFDSVLWQIHRDRIAFHFENTRASSETIINRAKLDIEEAIEAELTRA
ncbi:uncharacterized protein VTP21DRAFT_11743 [Calcarisporiella thermophila]|uniref:uncharacterized protein n=1 Tax=Calcarisporiella thermophila TaxID=911321 RepID=UPI0037444D0D